jgi:hypothetical protein
MQNRSSIIRELGREDVAHKKQKTRKIFANIIKSCRYLSNQIQI